MNIAILILGITFLIRQNQYFGWNSLPKSDAELICDGITLIIFSLAFISKK